MTEWVRNSQATFVANELYVKGRPHLDRVIIRIVPRPGCRQEDRQKVYAQALTVITEEPP